MFDRQRDTMAAKLGGDALGGRGGRGLLHKTADLARIRQEIGDNAVQQCLEQHRAQLGRACSKVFQSHGR